MRITVLVDSFVKGSIGYDRDCFLVKGRNAQWSSLYWDSSSHQSFHSHEPNLPCFVFKTCWSFHWKLKCSCISGISCISRSVQSWVCPALPFMSGFTSLSCCTQSITSVLFTPKWLPDQLVDKTPQQDTEYVDYITVLTQSVPVLPFELFPLLLCSSGEYQNQEEINRISITILRKLIDTRPVYTNECFACVIAYASFLLKDGLPSSEYPSFLYSTLTSIFKIEWYLHLFVDLVSGDESTLPATFQRLASFTNGMLVLASDRDQGKNVQKSGMFSMTNTDLQNKRKKQASLLESCLQLNYSFSILAAMNVDISLLSLFIEYISPLQASMNPTLMQQLVEINPLSHK